MSAAPVVSSVYGNEILCRFRSFGKSVVAIDANSSRSRGDSRGMVEKLLQFEFSRSVDASWIVLAGNAMLLLTYPFISVGFVDECMKITGYSTSIVK